ncbi:MAG: serine hydrolase [Sphingomonadales bacterium]|nr:serine hydrolase [Sphingomonadales bacterium]
MRAPRPATVAAPVPVQAWSGASASRSYGSGLEAEIAALANSSAGRIGVAALDLASGRSVAVLGDQPFPMASTSKIAIVATFLQGVDQGRFSLTSHFPLMMPVPSAKYSSAVAPVRPGAMMSAIDLIDRAIIHSDNHATDALLAAVGGPGAVNQWARNTAGLSGFRLDRDIATLVRDDGQYNPARTIDPRDSATPMTMVQLLTGVYQGRWLSRSSNAVLLSAMERCVTGKRRLRALLPSDAQVLHKTGTLSNTSSDVGIIKTPDGRSIAVAIYVTGQGGKAGRDARIANIARAIYDGYQVESSSFRRTASR